MAGTTKKVNKVENNIPPTTATPSGARDSPPAPRPNAIGRMPTLVAKAVECPVDAIRPDTEPGLEKWLQINTEYADKWPNITIKRDAPPDAAKYEDEDNKFEKYFSTEPGEGD